MTHESTSESRRRPPHEDRKTSSRRRSNGKLKLSRSKTMTHRSSAHRVMTLSAKRRDAPGQTRASGRHERVPRSDPARVDPASGSIGGLGTGPPHERRRHLRHAPAPGPAAARRVRGTAPGADLILHGGDLLSRRVPGGAPLARAAGARRARERRRAGAEELLPRELVVAAGAVQIGMVHNGGPAAGRPERLAARFPGCAGRRLRPLAPARGRARGGAWILNPARRRSAGARRSGR